MTVYYKYCGGCNPRFDRILFVEKLKRQFADINFIGQGEPIADLVIIICGCPSQCVRHQNITGDFTKLIVSSDQQYPLVCDEIARHFNKEQEI